MEFPWDEIARDSTYQKMKQCGYEFNLHTYKHFNYWLVKQGVNISILDRYIAGANNTSRFKLIHARYIDPWDSAVYHFYDNVIYETENFSMGSSLETKLDYFDEVLDFIIESYLPYLHNNVPAIDEKDKCQFEVGDVAEVIFEGLDNTNQRIYNKQLVKILSVGKKWITVSFYTNTGDTLTEYKLKFDTEKWTNLGHCAKLYRIMV